MSKLRTVLTVAGCLLRWGWALLRPAPEPPPRPLPASDVERIRRAAHDYPRVKRDDDGVWH